MIRADRPAAVHHHRQDDGSIVTRVVTRAPILLDPPGFELQDWWAEE